MEIKWEERQMANTIDRRSLLGGLTGLTATLGLPRKGGAQSRARITDGQVHIWQAHGDRPPSASGRQEPLLVEELLATLDANGVDRVVLVPPSWAARGNTYSLEAAAAYPDRIRVLGLAGRPAEDQAEAITHWLDTPGMAGLRMFLSNDAGAEYLASGGADWLWPILAENSIPVSVHAGDSLPVLAQAMERHPDLKLCLDAFGLGRNVEAEEALARFETVADTMAAFPNVMIKTGVIPRDSGDAFPFSNAQQLVGRVLETFGPQRLMYASDMTLLKSPYAEGLEFWRVLPDLPDTDRDAILGENMNRWLEWA